MLSDIAHLVAHPLTLGMDVDDPRTTAVRREIIRTKPFLQALYLEWYERILGGMQRDSRILELGSGAGFLGELAPGVITSEVFETPGIMLVANGVQLPFATGSLDAIVMTDVFHHISDVGAFLKEAARCVRVGGCISMVEPWRTPWSEWVYRNLHSEPFEPDAGWTIPASGPLSGANGALPWIVFERDRERFDMEFKQWGVKRVEPMMPVSYLLSGGVSMRGMMPAWSYRAIRFLEERFRQDRWAMFALIQLERQPC